MPISSKNTIGYNIKNLRRKNFPGPHGVKQCAGKYGVHQQQWRDWESGKRKPGKENQTILAKFFGITLSELRGEAPPAGAGAPIAPGVDEAEQRRMAEAMCEVAFIRYHLDVVQGYVLRGELSADAYLELTDSVLAAIQSTLAAHGKTLRTADPFAE